MDKIKKQMVTLKVKGDGGTKQTFEFKHALNILKLKNCQWELADDKHEFDGVELKNK